MNKERAALLRKIQRSEMILFDLSLYLDTHPKCQKGLAAYKRHQSVLLDYKEEFERRFGPLSHGAMPSSESWEWTDGPWPWEREANESGGMQ